VNSFGLSDTKIDFSFGLSDTFNSVYRIPNQPSTLDLTASQKP